MNEPRVYKNNTATMVLVFFLSVISLGGVCLGFGFVLESPLFAVLASVLVAIFLMFAIFSYTSKTIVSDVEITTSTLLGSKTLRWMEISSVSGSGNRIKLHNHDGDVTVSPNTRLPDYLEVIEWIGAKRPDLFDAQEFKEMRRGFRQVFRLLISLLSVSGAAVAYFGVVRAEAIASNESIGVFIFMGFIFLWILSSILSAPQSIVIEGGTVRLNYLLSKKELNASEIAKVFFTYTQTRYGKEFYVALVLPPDGRKILRIPSLSVGLPIGYLVLRNWHAKNK